MKHILFFLLFHLSFQIGFSQAETIQATHNDNDYFNISEPSNKKLLLFLHGGVINPYFKESKDISLEYLLEGNAEFIKKATENNFDVVLPITNDSLNWLDKNEFCFEEFKNYINSLNKNYEEIWISGFSDGGTGSYKMFYTKQHFFKGLIVFNGWPQHNNFNSTVDYSEVTDKKVIFFGTKKDKRILYEWSLAEYANQKKYNPNTFLYVIDGKHSFNAYKAKDLEVLYNIILEANNKEKKALHGLVINDELVEFYVFRKKIVRKYRFGKEHYIENKKQKKNN